MFDDEFIKIQYERARCKSALFEPGRIVATWGAVEALEAAGDLAEALIDRHLSGDWSDLSEDDRQENDFSVSRELRIFSTYHTSAGVKLWVITEADRGATTILLPSEY